MRFFVEIDQFVIHTYFFLAVLDVGLISKFAEYEVKYGDVERGVTLFETLLSHYPKRLDVCFVYIDMLASSEMTSQARFRNF